MSIRDTRTTRRRDMAARRRALAAIAVVPIATAGCSGSGFSMASLNPFGKGSDTSALVQTTPAGPPETAAAGPGRLASFGDADKGALDKTTGMFASKKDPSIITPTDDDPLSLSNGPTQVDPKTYVASGQLWESTGNSEKALESYRRALQADPSYTEALASIARLQYRQGQYPAAAESFQKAMAQKPNDAQLHDELGLTLQKLGRKDMAVQVLRRALQIAPKTSKYANHLASALYESGDTAGAFEVLSQNNKPAVAHFNMAYLYRKGGKLPEAKRHLTEALKSESTAAGDPVVGQAVSRSRDMLAQLNGIPTNNGGPAGSPTGPALSRPTSAIAAVKPPTQFGPTPSNPADSATGTSQTGFALPPAGTGTKIGNRLPPAAPAARIATLPSNPTAKSSKPAASGMALPPGMALPAGFPMPSAGQGSGGATPATAAPAQTDATDADMPAWLKEALGESK